MPLHPDVATVIARIETHALVAGISLQVLACLMNDSRFHGVQIGLGLVGVLLMIVGFHHLSE